MGRATAITARSPVSERVLITGASGFVGGHLAREWVDNGAEVLGISRRGTITEGSGLSVDLLNIDATRDAVAQFKPTVVSLSTPAFGDGGSVPTGAGRMLAGRMFTPERST